MDLDADQGKILVWLSRPYVLTSSRKIHRCLKFTTITIPLVHSKHKMYDLLQSLIYLLLLAKHWDKKETKGSK